MRHRPERIAAELLRSRDTGPLHTELERRMADGDAVFLGDLGAELLRLTAASSVPAWQHRSVLDTVVRLLALTPGRRSVEQLLRLTSGQDRAARKRARYAASLLTSAQDPDGLRPVFRGSGSGSGGSDELRACTLHELLVRGADLRDLPEAQRWSGVLRRGRHPLAWLPARRSALESGAVLPSHSLRGSMSPRPSSGGGAPVRRRTGGVAVQEVTAPAALSAATAGWVEESNGLVEARAFESAQPLEEGDLPGTLLGLACSGGSRNFSVYRSDAGAVWAELFAAACGGGAYGGALYGAYGRLAAWRSLGGLTGAAEEASFEEVEGRAASCGWYHLGTSTSWYHRLIWDIGVAALSPGRRRLTVLAATDTD
ncbi:DUF6183 family protein [Nocardiopsis algeriensis]|uniref:DUF6183 family protein n=1 Tax=Nocardiopsis algeriensis TaxID=1478215 RepID=UPI003B42E04C